MDMFRFDCVEFLSMTLWSLSFQARKTISIQEQVKPHESQIPTSTVFQSPWFGDWSCDNGKTHSHPFHHFPSFPISGGFCANLLWQDAYVAELWFREIPQGFSGAQFWKGEDVGEWPWGVSRFVNFSLFPAMWGPPVISWFINPINYSYKYHKP